mgnify:CR=1 FL=1
MWSVDRSVETGYVRRKSGEKEVFQMERPNEQTGEPTKPPPLSEELVKLGWQLRKRTSKNAWFYFLNDPSDPGVPRYKSYERPLELPQPEPLSQALIDMGWTIERNVRTGEWYYSRGARVLFDRPEESSAEPLDNAGTVLHERGGGGDDAMDVDSVVKTVEVDCPFLHDEIVDLTKIRADDPLFAYLAEALPGWEVERPVMYYEGKTDGHLGHSGYKYNV